MTFYKISVIIYKTQKIAEKIEAYRLIKKLSGISLKRREDESLSERRKLQFYEYRIIDR